MNQEEEIAGRFFEWDEEKNKNENYFRKIC